LTVVWRDYRWKKDLSFLCFRDDGCGWFSKTVLGSKSFVRTCRLEIGRKRMEP
jgi:hypothetical protein